MDENQLLNQVARNRKRPKEILDEAIKISNAEYNRPGLGLFLSSATAGMELALTLLVLAFISGNFSDVMSEEALSIVKGLGYTVGFIIVILGKSELFTEHTTLAVLPVLRKNQRLSSLMRLWVYIFAGNIIGGYFVGYFITLLGPHLLNAGPEVFEVLAGHLTEHPWYVMLGSGVFAGWLLGLLAWLDLASTETMSRIIIIGLITFIIGVANLHHSIVGSIEVFAGVISGEKITWADLGKFQFWSTLGNILGGVFFVAILKYSHTIRSSDDEEGEIKEGK